MKKNLSITKFTIICAISGLLSCTIVSGKESTPLTGGYVGSLPDVEASFQTSVPKVAKPSFQSISGFGNQFGIKPTPRDNAAFVNIILKKDKTSQYINDLNEIIPIIEKVYNSIETKENVQKFSAKVMYLNQNVDYLRRKYENKSESNYISFVKLMEVNLHTSTVATLRSEGLIYSPYLAYGDSGYIYNPNNIEEQLEYLRQEIEDVIVILKEAN